VLTVGWSALLLGEQVGVATLVAAVAVLVLTAATQRSRGSAPSAAPGSPGGPAENQERPGTGTGRLAAVTTGVGS
jgi:hypothetical protein